MRILDSDINLKQNLKESFHTHIVLWVILFVTVGFDFITTLSFMYDVGIYREKNYIIRWLASSLGIIPGVFIGKLLQIGAAIGLSALSLKYSRAILLLIILLNLLAVFINLL